MSVLDKGLTVFDKLQQDIVRKKLLKIIIFNEVLFLLYVISERSDFSEEGISGCCC